MPRSPLRPCALPAAVGLLLISGLSAAASPTAQPANNVASPGVVAVPEAQVRPVAQRKRSHRSTPALTAAKHQAAAAAAREATGAAYGRRPDVLALADKLAQAQQLDTAWVVDTLAQARFLPVVTRLIMPPPPGAPKNWAAYRARFVEPERVRAGVAFWQTNTRWLDAAQARYGVPPEVVVGIIGVETFYGRVTGNFRVLDALATLSLDFPSGRSDRSPFFQDELGQFLALAKRQGLAPDSVRGSFAGAIGLGQFMPGSINRHAVDFDGDGHIDMAGNVADVIGSVAHYLANHGWRAGQPTHYPVQPPTEPQALATLLAPDILPSFSPAQMLAQGAMLDAAAQAHEGPLALVQLQNGEAAPSYVAGTQNFYAVTRYNWSAYYALAVIDLGRAVAAARPTTSNTTTTP